MTSSWVLNALLANICFTACTILFKLLLASGASSSVIVGGAFGVAAIIMLPILISKCEAPFKYPSRMVVLMIILGIFAYIGNVFQVRSIALAPNPGFTSAIIGAQSLVVAVVSWWFLGTELTKAKFIGITLCGVGVILISI